MKKIITVTLQVLVEDTTPDEDLELASDVDPHEIGDIVADLVLALHEEDEGDLSVFGVAGKILAVERMGCDGVEDKDASAMLLHIMKET